MTGITAGKTWSRVGPEVAPTSSSASGVWTLQEYSENQGAGTWPNPVVAWLGVFDASFYASSPHFEGSCCDDQNNVFITSYGTMASGHQGGSVSRITSSGVMTNTMYQTSPSTSGAFSIRDVVFDATDNSLFAVGSQYQNAAGANNRVGVGKFNEGLTTLTYQINNNSASQFQDFGHVGQNGIGVGTSYFNIIGQESTSSGYKTLLAFGNKSDGARYSSPREFINTSSSVHVLGIGCVMAPSQVGYGLARISGDLYLYRGGSDGDSTQCRRTDSQLMRPWDIKNKGTSEQVIVGGYGTNASSTSRVFIVALNTASKVISWQKQISLQSTPASPNEAHTYQPSIAVDSSENVYVAWEEKINSGNYTANVVKYNTSGTLQWVRSLRCTSSAVRFSNTPSLSVSSDDSFVYLYTEDSSNTQAFLLQLTSDGAGTGATMTLGGHSFILETPSHQNAAGTLDTFQSTSSTGTYNQTGSSAVATAANGFTANTVNYLTKGAY